MTAQKKYTSTASTLAIAALCFFAVIIQGQIKNKQFGLNEKETQFVQGYINYGYMMTFFLVIVIITGVLSLVNNRDRLNIINSIAIIITILGLIVGIILAISEKELYTINLQKGTTETETNTADVILSFLPIYNFYSRHTEKPHTWTKESITQRGLIIGVTIIDTTNFLSVVLLVLLLIRVIALIVGFDVLPKQLIPYLTNTFQKFPEELTAYLTGTLKYTRKTLSHKQADLIQIIQKEKTHYQQQYSTDRQGNYRYIPIVLLIAIVIRSYIQGISLNPEYSIDILIWIILMGKFIVNITSGHTPHIPLLEDSIQRIKKSFTQAGKKGENK